MPENESQEKRLLSRRSILLRGGALAGTLGVGIAMSAVTASALSTGSHKVTSDAWGGPNGLTTGDLAIVGAAQIAEALAVTTYTNIINLAPFFQGIPDDDQGYLEAARQEEMSHYLLEQSGTGKPSPYTTFYYPPHMFSDTQTTLNVLVTLEDAFIAAYLVGVRDLSTPDLRVTAARIMGIESDHRTLARVIGPDVATANGGPIGTITGIQGVTENVAPPNNNGYERTLQWTSINSAVSALTPFLDKTAAAKAGFDTSKPYQFVPFVPVLPSPLGDFHSFLG
jgi:Ferritin-like domain